MKEVIQHGKGSEDAQKGQGQGQREELLKDGTLYIVIARPVDMKRAMASIRKIEKEKRMAKKKNWIAEATKNVGGLTKVAKHSGAMTRKGTISKAFIAEKTSAPGKVGKEARLAQTLASLRKKKK
jgi:hypothetical protein